MKVLIVAMEPVRVVLRALPVLDFLRQAVPGAVVDWIADEGAHEVVAGNPLLRKVHAVPAGRLGARPFHPATLKEVLRLREELLQEAYDIVFDLQGTFRSGIISWLTGCPRRYGFEKDAVRDAVNVLLTNNQVPLRRQDRHAENRPLRLVSVPFGRDYTRYQLAADVGTTPEEETAADALFATISDDLVLLFHLGGRETRLWFREGWVELGKQVLERLPDATLLLSWKEPQERKLAEEVAAGIGYGARILPELSVRMLAAIIRKADLVVGGDTMPVQLAATVGTPTVSFYRATDSRTQGPRAPQHVLLQSPLACAGCSRKNCDRDAECSRSITVSEMMRGIDRVLFPDAASAKRNHVQQ